MNVLMIIGLVVFAFIIASIYVLFTFGPTWKNKGEKEEPITIDVVERCNQLFNEGLQLELQRYAKRELTKNYGNLELRKILAKSLMTTGDINMAISHYEAILTVHPEDYETRIILADYYFKNELYNKAIELYEQILQDDPNDIETIKVLAQIYEKTQHSKKALAMYKIILESETDEEKITELHYKIADFYMKSQDIENAYREYKNILEKNPDNIEVKILLADLSFQNNKWEECLRYNKEILATSEDDLEIIQKIAQLQVTLEQWGEAIETFKKIIKIETEKNPNYLYHQNELCNAMIKNNQCREAIEILKNLISRYPRETSFMFTLAQALGLCKKYQEGIDLYSKLLENLPPEQNDIVIKYISNLIANWAQDLFEQGQYNLAFDKFFEGLKLDEDNDNIYFKLGKCNYQIKSFQDAISHFKRAISIKPQNALYYYALGCTYDESGQNKDAKIAFKDAINLDPTFVKARIGYAISLTKELEYAKSISEFNEVLKYVPNDADTIYNIALAYELVGEHEKAAENYRKAIDVQPNHKEAAFNLKLLTGEDYFPAMQNQFNHNESENISEYTKSNKNNIIETNELIQDDSNSVQQNDVEIDVEDFKQFM